MTSIDKFGAEYVNMSPKGQVPAPNILSNQGLVAGLGSKELEVSSLSVAGFRSTGSSLPGPHAGENPHTSTKTKTVSRSRCGSHRCRMLLLGPGESVYERIILCPGLGASFQDTRLWGLECRLEACFAQEPARTGKCQWRFSNRRS